MSVLSCRLSTGVQQASNRHPTGSQQAVNRHPTGSQQASNRHPTGSQQASNRHLTGRGCAMRCFNVTGLCVKEKHYMDVVVDFRPRQFIIELTERVWISQKYCLVMPPCRHRRILRRRHQRVRLQPQLAGGLACMFHFAFFCTLYCTLHCSYYSRHVR